MNIIFMGTPDFSVPILRTLAEKYQVKLVITQPDKPKGRKKRLAKPPVKEAAETLGLPVFQPKRLKNAIDEVLAYDPDLIVTAAYGQILPGTLLDAPEHGAINVHASLLPKLRGGAPIQRAIERGYTWTGVTVMKMGRGMDTGPILGTRAIEIREDETGGSLFQRLSLLGRDLLMDILEDYLSGAITPVPQDDSEATYAYAIKREEERLDLTRSAIELERKVRAFHPSPNTYLMIGEARLKVIMAKAVEDTSDKAPGTVVKADGEGVRIACGEGVLSLSEVQPPSKKPMDAVSFMNGAGRQWLKKGDNLLS